MRAAILATVEDLPGFLAHQPWIDKVATQLLKTSAKLSSGNKSLNRNPKHRGTEVNSKILNSSLTFLAARAGKGGLRAPLVRIKPVPVAVDLGLGQGV